MSIIYEPKGRAGEYASLAANLYKGCVHGCRYCYVPDMVHRERKDFHSESSVRPDALKHLEDDLKAMKLKGDTRPVFISFTTDPYQPIEKEKLVTRESIKLMHKYDVPVTILTKGADLACRDFDLLDKRDWFGVTLTFTYDDETCKWEPKASTTLDRLVALKLAHNRGIHTWVSCEPVIDPIQTLNLIKSSELHVDMFKVGKWNHAKEANKIDWKQFGTDAEALLKSLGKSYVIKQDLRECMRSGKGEK